MSESKRLFVGARVAVGTANSLSNAAETLARRARDAGVDIRWVAPVNYHVTLAFLGNTRIDAILAVLDVLEAATVSPRITFRTTRLGGFPALDKARVIWAGVEDPGGALAALATQIGQGLATLGLGDRKPFHAHVTLGRVAGKLDAVKSLVLPLAEQMFGETRIDGITLFENDMKSSGSVYRELSRIAFKTAETIPGSGVRRQTQPLDVEPHDTVETDDGWPRHHRTD